MQFLAPSFLWTLAALAPLAAIYFLKVRPRKRPATAYFLWQKIFTEKKASALFKKLRDHWSLLLMMLAFAAIAFALAEPDFAGDERKDLLIVVDHSASMSALDSKGNSRLASAKKRARDLIAALNGSQRAAVASFSDHTEMRAHVTRHRKSLLDAVDGIQPTELPSRVNAIKSLQPGTEWMENTRVILITDGCLDAAVEMPQVELLLVGDDRPNAGLARADLRPVPGGVNRMGLFLVPVSSFPDGTKADVLLRHEDSSQLIKVIPLTLANGENPAVTLLLDDAPAGRWTASLSLEDALATDNTVYLSVPAREPVPVGILADDPYFLQHVVGAFERSGKELTLTADANSAKLFLARGQTPLQGHAVVFQPQGDSPFWTAPGEELAAVVPQVMMKDHPLLRFVDAETMAFTGARKITAPAGSLVLVQDETGTPLIHLMNRGEQSVCVVNMDPLAAQFYLSAWFPVLVHNAAAHLTHRNTAPPATVPCGQSQEAPGLATGELAQIAREGGAPRDFVGPATGPLVQSGFYTVTMEKGGAATDGRATVLGCSLVSPEESLPRAAQLKETATPVASGQSPSYWLLVFAVVVLAAESLLYHRRKVG